MAVICLCVRGTLFLCAAAVEEVRGRAKLRGNSAYKAYYEASLDNYWLQCNISPCISCWNEIQKQGKKGN